VSNVPKGYLHCPKCNATFPQRNEEGKTVDWCPGCGISVDAIRVKTARYMMRMTAPMATQGSDKKLIVVAALIFLASIGASVAVALHFRG
jgi:hypothetical protein